MRHKLTIEFEAEGHREAIAESERAMDAFGSLLDHTLEVQINEDKPDEAPTFEPVEA